MAITHVASSNANNASANSLTPAEPTGTAENDLVLALANIHAPGGTWTDPADFTQIDTRDWGLATDSDSRYLGYKIRGATEGSGYNFSSSSAAAQMVVALVTLRGIDLTTPLDVVFSGASHFNEYDGDVKSAAPAITTVTNGAWVVLFQHWVGAIAGFTLGAPSGYTTLQSLLQASRTSFINAKEIAAAGTETPGVYTTTGTEGTANDSANYTLAIRPASAGVNIPRLARYYEMMRSA